MIRSCKLNGIHVVFIMNYFSVHYIYPQRMGGTFTVYYDLSITFAMLQWHNVSLFLVRLGLVLKHIHVLNKISEVLT